MQNGDRPSRGQHCRLLRLLFTQNPELMKKKVLKPLNLYGLIIFWLKWRKTNCSEHHVKGGVLEPPRQRMPLRLGFTASKCTSCKKAGERRAHTSDFHLQAASSQLTAVLVVNSGASVMTSALKQGHFAMLYFLHAGSFSEVHLSPPFLLLHKKSHFGAQHFIPRRMAREREDRVFFFASPAPLLHQNVLTSHAMSFKLKKFIRSSKVGGTAASTAGAASLTLSAPLQ
jgi:hypothetical protein